MRSPSIGIGLLVTTFAAAGLAQPAPGTPVDEAPDATSPELAPTAEAPAAEAPPAETPTPSTSPAAGAVGSYPPAASLRPIPPGELWREDEDARDMRYPGYFAAGIITLGAGVGFAVGSIVSAFEHDDRAAIGLGSLATIAWGTGIPLTLLGATPDPAGDSATAYAGIALATPGILSIGLGGTLWAARKAEEQEDPDYIAPIVLVAGGGAALVAGIITWAIGASRDDDDDERRAGLEAELVVSPTSLGLRGRF